MLLPKLREVDAGGTAMSDSASIGQDQVQDATQKAEIMTCPECGMAREKWPNPKGYEKNGQAFCCQGCAEGSGCTCRR